MDMKLTWNDIALPALCVVLGLILGYQEHRIRKLEDQVSWDHRNAMEWHGHVNKLWQDISDVQDEVKRFHADHEEED